MRVENVKDALSSSKPIRYLIGMFKDAKIAYLPKKIPKQVIWGSVAFGAATLADVAYNVSLNLSNKELLAQTASIQEAMKSWFDKPLGDGSIVDRAGQLGIPSDANGNIIYFEAVDIETEKKSPNSFTAIEVPTKTLDGTAGTHQFLVIFHEDGTSTALHLTDTEDVLGSEVGTKRSTLVESDDTKFGAIEVPPFDPTALPNPSRPFATLFIREIVLDTSGKPITFEKPFRLQLQGTLSKEEWQRFNESLNDVIFPIKLVQAQGLPTESGTASATATKPATATEVPLIGSELMTTNIDGTTVFNFEAEYHTWPELEGLGPEDIKKWHQQVEQSGLVLPFPADVLKPDWMITREPRSQDSISFLPEWVRPDQQPVRVLAGFFWHDSQLGFDLIGITQQVFDPSAPTRYRLITAVIPSVYIYNSGRANEIMQRIVDRNGFSYILFNPASETANGQKNYRLEAVQKLSSLGWYDAAEMEAAVVLWETEDHPSAYFDTHVFLGSSWAVLQNNRLPTPTATP